MAGIDEILELAKRDPVRVFVSIPIAAAKPPRPAIVVDLRGSRLKLPDWSGDEWIWFGDLAIAYSDSGDKSRDGAESISKANRKLTALRAPMKSLGDKHPEPKDAAAFYDAAIRLVIAAAADFDPNTGGPKFVDCLREAIPRIPRTIGEAVASVASVGAAAIKPIAEEAGKILAELFGAVLKPLGGGIALLALGAFALWYLTKGKNHGEAS